MKPIKHFLLAISVLALLACNAVSGLFPTSTPVVVVVTATPNPSSSATSPVPTVQAASPVPRRRLLTLWQLLVRRSSTS